MLAPGAAASDVEVTFQKPAGGGYSALTPTGVVQPIGGRIAIAPPAASPAEPTVNVRVSTRVSQPGADAGRIAAAPCPFPDPKDSGVRSTTNVLATTLSKPVGSSTSAVAA